MFRKIQLFMLVCLTVVCSSCSAAVQAPSFDPEVLYQVSSIDSLFSGHFDGIESLGWLKSRGDLGIGTFHSLDGELIMLDGHVYQSRSDGKLVEPPDGMQVPFANVTHFDQDIRVEAGSIADAAALQQLLVDNMPRKDAFYAIRVDAVFSHVKVRTVPAQSKPYPALDEILKNPVVFTADNIKGSVVGFWSPEYVGKLNLPGFNLHFVSDDRQFGGHLVEAVLTDAKISLDETRGFTMTLGQPGR